MPALARVGGAITASAMATIMGLSMMYFAEFGRFRYGGLTIALALAVALAASLTLCAALLRAGGDVIFWPLCAQNREEATALRRDPFFNRMWEKIGQTIVARPGLIFLGSLLIMAWPAYQGFSVPVTYDLLTELNPQQFSIQGTKLLTRYFPTGQTGPITVLAHRNDPALKSAQGKAEISQLTEDFYELNFDDPSGKQTRPIVSVRSRSNPLGGKPGVPNPFSAPVGATWERRAIRKFEPGSCQRPRAMTARLCDST